MTLEEKEGTQLIYNTASRFLQLFPLLAPPLASNGLFQTCHLQELWDGVAALE